MKARGRPGSRTSWRTSKPGDILTRDEDVLDTWFSSALWPFSTLGWPDKTPELEALLSDQRAGHRLRHHLLLGRPHDDDGPALHGAEVPFHTVYVHALVRDKNGAKMSKSKGNVIDPLELIDEYGADALRFTLAIMAAQGRDVKLDPRASPATATSAPSCGTPTRFAEMNGARATTRSLADPMKPS
jgi:valyl-tRNA synthetase